MRAYFDHAVSETEQITSFYFRPERALHYTAGQFIELTLKHSSPDRRGIRRWFTLSSSPSESLLAITTRLTPERPSSFKTRLYSLQPGDEVAISEAMGDFVLPKLLQTPLLFVAAGVGITPFRSILTWLADSQEQRQVALVYGVSSEDDIIFQDRLDAAAQRVTIVPKHPSDSWGGERGHLSADTILALETPSPDTMIYLAGPEAFVEQLYHEFLKAGIHRQQLLGDSFPGYNSW